EAFEEGDRRRLRRRRRRTTLGLPEDAAAGARRFRPYGVAAFSSDSGHARERHGAHTTLATREEYERTAAGRLHEGVDRPHRFRRLQQGRGPAFLAVRCKRLDEEGEVARARQLHPR